MKFRLHLCTMVMFVLSVLLKDANSIFKASSNLSIALSTYPLALLGSQLSFLLCKRGEKVSLSVQLLFKINHLVLVSLRNIAIIDSDFLMKIDQAVGKTLGPNLTKMLNYVPKWLLYHERDHVMPRYCTH